MAKQVRIQDEPSGPKNPVLAVKRKCRDILFLILFIAFWIGMIIIAINGIKQGDPKRLITPKDYLGNYCGYDNTNTSAPLSLQQYQNQSTKPFVYFFDIAALEKGMFVCVNSCPNATQVLLYPQTLCSYNVTPTATNYAQLILNGSCAAYTLESTPILNRCIPTAGITTAVVSATGANATAINSSNPLNSILGAQSDSVSRAVADLTVTWPVLLAGAIAAILISFIWMALLQFFAPVFVWLNIILANLVFIVGAIWLYFYWQARQAYLNGTSYELLKDGIGSQIAGYVGLNSNAITTQSQVTLVQYTFIVIAVLAGILLLITIAMIKRIRIAVSIIKQASKAMMRMPFIVVFPMFIWVLVLANMLYFVWILLYLVTPTGPFVLTIEAANAVWKDDNINNYILAYHTFGFLWTNFFFLGISEVAVAGAIGTWYWTLDKKQKIKQPILRSIGRTLLYHLGSIAIGSLLIAIVEFIRIVLYQLQKKVNKSGNKYIKYLVACLQCCMKVVSVIVKFINRNAYVYIALTGKAFFSSAGAATGLLMRNALRTVAVDFVADFILILSKLAVTGVTALCAYVYLTSYGATLGSISQPAVTVALVAIAAFMISTAIFGVYQMAINTIFLSFCKDSEENDGSAAKPFYMTDELKKIMGVHNKFPSNQGGRVEPIATKEVESPASSYASPTSQQSPTKGSSPTKASTNQKKVLFVL